MSSDSNQLQAFVVKFKNRNQQLGSKCFQAKNSNAADG